MPCVQPTSTVIECAQPISSAFKLNQERLKTSSITNVALLNFWKKSPLCVLFGLCGFKKFTTELTENTEFKTLNEKVNRIAGLSFSTWTILQVLKSIRFCMLLGSPSISVRDSIDEELEALTGSSHVAKTLHALSPGLADLIQSKLTALDVNEGLQLFFKQEKDTFHTLVDALLPILYKNLAKNVKAQKAQSRCFADVVGLICKIIDAHVPYINDNLGMIESEIIEEKKDQLICQVFSGLVDDFLSVALPCGAGELPLTKIPFISEHYWNTLKKQILPFSFYRLYNQFALPIRENKKDVLLKMAGGKSLFSLAQLASEQAIERLPEIFSHDGTSTDDLVIKMGKGFSTLLDGSELFKTWIGNWFAKELMVFSERDNIYLNKLWNLLGGYVEPLLVHVFVTMSDVELKVQGRTPDVIGIIIIRILLLSTRFHDDNKKQIYDRIEQLKKIGENYKEDKVLLDIFKPFAADLIALMGLDNSEKLPLPWFLKGLITEPLKKAAPAFLLRQYVADLNID